MPISKLLIANRGEIAIRVSRAAAELGIATVAVYSEDDASCLHRWKADEALSLPGRGVAAYLDQASLIDAARNAGADAIHPGYGFLAENGDFAAACAEAGLTFVGPTPTQLRLFGDKHQARALARENEVPILPGTAAPTQLADALAFLEGLGEGGAVMIKAVAGGGGRGMRPVDNPNALEEAFTRAASEAAAGFGNGDLYVEQLLPSARHVEVQIIGDGQDVSHVWERDCTLQRRRQKIIEVAPAPDLTPELRAALLDAAVKLAKAAGYRGLGTFEFLVDRRNDAIFFIEANARLQVEHTVTEEVTGIDLVTTQLSIAGGASLADLHLTQDQIAPPKGFALQARLNTETMTDAGEAKPGGGELQRFDLPSGRGIRVDHHGYAGYRTNPAFDPLLAKVIVQGGVVDWTGILAKARLALAECQITGVPNNVDFLQALLAHPSVQADAFDTGFIAQAAAELLEMKTASPGRYPTDMTTTNPAQHAGAKVDHSDPLAVLAYGQSANPAESGQPGGETALGDGLHGVRAPIQGTVLSFAVEAGDTVAPGQDIAVLEAMKMEHVVSADRGGVVQNLHAAIGDTLWEDQLLLSLTPDDTVAAASEGAAEIDPDHIRKDLQDVLDRRDLTRDAARPDAVARRRKTGQRTVRENVDDLVDPGSFVEYGPLVVAAQRQRRGFDDLLQRSPADGLITGVGRVNGELFADPAAQAAVMAYDYTVFAGTQGVHNHWKTDRLIHVAEQGRMPFILFAEGGGGRPGDTDYGGFVGQNTFHHFGQLSGLVPMVGIVSGRCFAGNAALLGCCDVIIATEDANIGMGGPAMIEGGGLGVFRPEDIGPIDVQTRNGVVDLAARDEAEAVAQAKRYLSYFQGPLSDWSAPDQRRLRGVVPENRLRVYDIRQVIDILCDDGSVMELRRAFGETMVTALARVEGRAIGIIANDPLHLGGAIDSDGADKAARFMQLCDAFDLPLLYLCDTPGIMVGPEAEKTALVRHASRLFLVGCNLSVPYFTVITRKAYGLGAIGMAGGNFTAPYFCVSWPTGEFGPMGLEGQVKLGYRAELAAIEDSEARRQHFEELVAQSYEDGKALERATTFAIDDTIDPAETRHWLTTLLAAIRPPAGRDGKKRPMIDAW